MLKYLVQTFKPKLARAAGIFGQINPPPGVDKYTSSQGEGLIKLLNNILKLMIIGAGIFALVNFVVAGYGFMNAGGDAKKVEAAWAKVWQSLLGLLITAGAFTIAAVAGQIIFGDWSAILQPKIYEPY